MMPGLLLWFLVVWLPIESFAQIPQEVVMPMSVQAIKEKHQASLLAMPGVLSVGIGQDEAGSKVIIVGINNNDRSILAAIPSQLEQVPVKIQLIGTVQAQD